LRCARHCICRIAGERARGRVGVCGAEAARLL